MGIWTRVAEHDASRAVIAAAASRVQARRRAVQGWVEPEAERGEVWHLAEEAVTVWAMPDARSVTLLDIDAPARYGDDPQGLRQLLAELAAAAGWTGNWRFGVIDGDPLLASLTGIPDARRVATKMQLDVRDAPDPVGVGLQPMDDADYAAYREHADEEYAQERFAAGADPSIEAARNTAAAQMIEMLPDGPRTAGQLLWTVRDDEGERTGILWVAIRDGFGFINDISLDESRRGQGIGTQALRAAAAEIRAAGLDVLALNVFGSNDDARRLYAREGFAETETLWTAPIEVPSGS
ncbi:GNAT family N-acetyltransferase [Microbacterium esteraromaticum]|uniref:GNAT family N-acetyltransferase n=1 Tax=Microbacterium esteraromaticum TaxID=57043 RepID=UPI00195859DC|nr:GNAT family N-acetyltransferase [Microbacterium esteraromaticum]MBM7464895.1 GNAT superfamily N-acetyltransferase [Microbacterium esteraromaticum]